MAATFEKEYYLAREQEGQFVPFDVASHAPVYSAIGHDLNAELMVEITDALGAQGITVEQAINEFGAGQQEISVRHADALTAADNQMKFRDTVRGVALRHGLLASFAPKPFPDQIGSGAHVHFSLWDGEGDGARSVLYDKSAPRGLSAIGRHFIARVTEHLPALVALTAPSYNSYSRLVPSAWASATTAWGFDNKEAALRVCSPFYQREEQSYNVEFKTVDASSNPYLALGALIACGLDGIERELEPGEPCEHDPARLTPEELALGRVRPLPTSMSAALDELEKTSSCSPAWAVCCLAATLRSAARKTRRSPRTTRNSRSATLSTGSEAMADLSIPPTSPSIPLTPESTSVTFPSSTTTATPSRRHRSRMCDPGGGTSPSHPTNRCGRITLRTWRSTGGSSAR